MVTIQSHSRITYYVANTWFVIAVTLLLAGCTRPALTEDGGAELVVETTGISFRMVDAGFWTNRTLRSDRIRLESDDFVILFVYLPESGLYLVTVEQSEVSVQSGRFVGSELVFSGGNTEIRFLSEGGHLFTDRVDREAWVEFLPGLIVSPSGASIEGPIVGLARLRSHVPGL